MKLTTIGAIGIIALGLILLTAGSRGTYRVAWQTFTQPASKTPKG